MKIEKLNQLYEGKAKKVFETDDPELLIVDYKDDATAFNGLKKGTIDSARASSTTSVSNYLMKMLEQHGIPTHLVEELSDRETVVKKRFHRAAGGHRAQHRRRLALPSAWACRRARSSRAPCWSSATRTTRWAIPWSTTITSAPWSCATQGRARHHCQLCSQDQRDAAANILKELNIELIDFKLEFGKTRRRHDHSGRRDFPRYLPLLGQQDRRKAGQGPLPPRPGRRRGRLPGDPAAGCWASKLKYCRHAKALHEASGKHARGVRRIRHLFRAGTARLWPAPPIYALYALQHRGQDELRHRGGRRRPDHERTRTTAWCRRCSTARRWNRWATGHLAIGHVRYGTSGDARPRINAQPLVVRHVARQHGAVLTTAS